MILTCPSCTAKFMISSEALGADGREVRCGKCGHMWFQKGERDSLDDLMPVEEEDHPEKEQRDAFDIAFEPHVDKPEPPRAEAPVSKSSSSKDERVIKENIEVDMKDRKPIISRQKQKHIAGVLAALAVVTIAAFAFVLLKNPLGRNVAFFGAAYEKMGFMIDREDPKFAFDRIKLSRTDKDLSGAGTLINLTSEKLPVKEITVDLLDKSGQILKSTGINIKDDMLEAESTQKIGFTIKDAPAEADNVRLLVRQ